MIVPERSAVVSSATTSSVEAASVDADASATGVSAACSVVVFCAVSSVLTDRVPCAALRYHDGGCGGGDCSPVPETAEGSGR